MKSFPYSLIPASDVAPSIGLIVLQMDETLEPEFTASFAAVDTATYITRIPSGAAVTPESLCAMREQIAASADLLPKSIAYRVVGFGCTSASAIIGSAAVERLVQSRCDAPVVTNPLRAVLAYGAHLGVSRLAVLSPYTEDVNVPLRAALRHGGLSSDVFGSFCEPQEAKVARISTPSIVEAGVALGRNPDVDALFISCTNLKTASAIAQIQDQIAKPTFSSNSALFWHMKYCAKL